MAEPLTVADYWRVVHRRIPHIVAPFLALAVVAVFVVLLLPPIYRSTGTVAVESQQIPEDLVRSTVLGSAEQRIGYIAQIVMTDARLEEIIHQFGLYPETMATSPVATVIAKLRRNILVEAIRDPYGSRATIAFKVSFDHPDPATARDVAATLVDLFLAENARTRNVRATETAAFLKQETTRLGEEVRSLDQQVAEYKRKHTDALPEHLTLRVNMLQRAEFDLRAVQREIAAAEQERRFLETQISTLASRPAAKAGRASGEMTPEERLAALKAELATASGIYTDVHPDILRLRRLVASAEAEVRRQTEGRTSDVPAAPSPEREQLDGKVVSLEARLASLRDQEQELSERVETLQSQILQTHEVEQGLREISLAYEAAAKDYEGIRSKLQQAELAESLESQKMAERFVLLEPPAIPLKADRPQRSKLLLVGLVVALGAGLGVAFAAEMLDTRVQDPAMLAGLIGYRPLAVLPYVELVRERRHRIVAATGAWVGFLATLGVAVVIGLQYTDPLADALRRLYY